jgi:hypothetical protein
MATDKATFAEMELGGATGSDVIGKTAECRAWHEIRSIFQEA